MVISQPSHLFIVAFKYLFNRPDYRRLALKCLPRSAGCECSEELVVISRVDIAEVEAS